MPKFCLPWRLEKLMEKEIQRFEKYNEMGYVMAFGGGLVRRNDWLCRKRDLVQENSELKINFQE